MGGANYAEPSTAPFIGKRLLNETAHIAQLIVSRRMSGIAYIGHLTGTKNVKDGGGDIEIIPKRAENKVAVGEEIILVKMVRLLNGQRNGAKRILKLRA